MKKYARRLIPIIYLGIAFYCLLLVINPGSAIFYFKRTLKSDQITPYRANSYRYLIRVIPLVSPTQGVILYEDGKTLLRTLTANVIKKGNGTYSLGDPSEGTYYLRFSATDNSDPRSNGRRYILYHPVVFLSRTLGRYYLGVLLLGVVSYLGFSPEFSAYRKSIRKSTKQIFRAFVNFINRVINTVFSPITRLLPFALPKDILWKSLYTLTVGAAYAYVFMEWLFFVTKPSFMDLMGWAEKLEILLLTGLAVAFISGNNAELKNRVCKVVDHQQANDRSYKGRN